MSLDGAPPSDYLRCWCGRIHWRSKDGCHSWWGVLWDNIREW